jgi:hypothetical protein
VKINDYLDLNICLRCRLERNHKSDPIYAARAKRSKKEDDRQRKSWMTILANEDYREWCFAVWGPDGKCPIIDIDLSIPPMACPYRLEQIMSLEMR